MIGSCVGRSRRELRRTRTLKIPRAERRRTIVFLGLDGHHNWGSEGAMVGAKWLTDHRDEVFAKTALMINCEHPSTVQTTVRPRYLDHNHPLVICMSSAVMSTNSFRGWPRVSSTTTSTPSRRHQRRLMAAGGLPHPLSAPHSDRPHSDRYHRQTTPRIFQRAVFSPCRCIWRARDRALLSRNHLQPLH